METEYEICFKFKDCKRFKNFIKYIDEYLDRPDNRGKHTAEIHRQTREFLNQEGHRDIPYKDAYSIVASRYKTD